MQLAAGLFPSSWTGTTPFQLPLAANVVAYVVVAVVVLAVLGVVILGGRTLSPAAHWTTQDLLVVAIVGVLLEVYDNLIGDQFVTPLTEGIPFTHAFALNDLPYMFLLMVGIAIIRKPGAATALVFLNFLLMQILYGGAESSPLWWPYGLMQGVFVDLYMLARRGRVFSDAGLPAVLDGLAMGALRAVPAVMVASAIMWPLLGGQTDTGRYILLYGLFNLVGNGLEAGITSPLAIRIARTVNPAAGHGVDAAMPESDRAHPAAGTPAASSTEVRR